MSASAIASTVSASPTSASTASPRKRTRPSASTGWSLRSAKIAKRCSARRPRVTTSTRPGQRARSAPRSPSSKAAWACGERTTRIVSDGNAPARGSSSAPKRSVPVTLAGASSRGARAPTARPAAGSGIDSTVARGDRQHRLDDLAVAGAAAQHAAERVEHLGLARPRVRAQQRLGAISMPGVQIPHCAAPCATKARCSADSVPSAAARPSTVVDRAAGALRRAP